MIVHKVDRLARNRADDVEINLALKAAGATLVSCSENIDETPSGMLLHGIMSSIAEFYSRNLANEIIKGSVQKAKTGGTVGKAPLGYLNVRTIVNGTESRTVEIDPVRGPLVKWAFETYATGDWSLHKLHDEITRRGLETTGTLKRPPSPLHLSHLHRVLIHPYYKGVVRYRGIEYPGKHEPLITPGDLAADPGRPPRAPPGRRPATRTQPLPQRLRLLRHLQQPTDRQQRPQPPRQGLPLLRLRRPPPEAHRLHLPRRLDRNRRSKRSPTTTPPNSSHPSSATLSNRASPKSSKPSTERSPPSRSSWMAESNSFSTNAPSSFRPTTPKQYRSTFSKRNRRGSRTSSPTSTNASRQPTTSTPRSSRTSNTPSTSPPTSRPPTNQRHRPSDASSTKRSSSGSTSARTAKSGANSPNPSTPSSTMNCTNGL